jgi:hypothetical protein
MQTAAQRLPRHLRTAAALALIFTACALPASAEQPASKQIAAKLVCGSFSADPYKMKPFEAKFQFTVSGPLWTSDVADPRGKERFLGILSPSGTMLIVGEGKRADGATWTYEFSGRKKQDSLTILRGSLQSQKPKGSRACSLAF